MTKTKKAEPRLEVELAPTIQAADTNVSPCLPAAVAKRRGRPTREEVEARAKRKGQTDFLVGCTLDERALCVRLVGLNRENYWLAGLVRQILRLDRDSPHQVTLADVRNLITQFESIEALAANARVAPRNIWGDNPILTAIREEWSDIDDYLDERAVDRLIKSAATVRR